MVSKEFIEKYGGSIKGKHIELVQMMVDDKTRNEIAVELGADYKAIAARIAKIKRTVGVVEDAALVAFFFRNGLVS